MNVCRLAAVAVNGLLEVLWPAPDNRPRWLTDMDAATDVEVARILRGDPPPCEHRYCHKQGYAMCFGVTGAQMDMLENRHVAAEYVANRKAQTPAVFCATASGNPTPADTHPVDVGRPAPVDPAGPGAGHLTWFGWSVPAILDCLAEHHPHEGAGCIVCAPADEGFETPYSAEHLQHFATIADWREHVAPILAARIGCNPSKAIAALQSYTPTT